MIGAPQGRGFSRSLLTRAMRFAAVSEAARQRLVASARAHDVSSEERGVNHDSPWRSIALLLRHCGDIPGSQDAFGRAQRWLDDAVAAESNVALAMARRTIQALCRVQSGETTTIPSAALIEILACAERATPNDAAHWARHLATNRQRVAFLAQYFRVTDVLPAENRWTVPVIASLDVEYVHAAILDTWTAARFSVEVAERQMLEERLAALLDGGAVLAAACEHLPRTLDAEAAVASYVKHYLSAVDFCEPSTHEATRAVEQLHAAFRRFNLQRSQSVVDRTLTLLASSVVTSTLLVDDVSQMVDSLSRDMQRCAETARHVGLSVHRVNSLLRQPLREFVVGDLRRQCLLLPDVDRRIDALRKLSGVSEAIGALDAQAVVEITSLFTMGQALPSPLLGPAVAEAFGTELRRRADHLTADAGRSIGQSVQTAVQEECQRFFRAAVLEAFAGAADPETSVQHVRDAASVFATAGMLSSSRAFWDAAIFALKHADAATATPLLERWVLTTPELSTALWLHFTDLVDALVPQGMRRPRIAGDVFRLLFDADADKLLTRMFGGRTDAAMLPLALTLVTSRDPRVDELLVMWLTHAARRESNDMVFACGTVEMLLAHFPDETTDEGRAALRAARDLATAKLAAIDAASRPHLVPVTARFASAFLKHAGVSELRSHLAEISGGAAVPLALDASLLTRAEAEQVLDLLARDAGTYTSTELSDARVIAADICGRGLADWRQELAQLFVRYVEPELPRDRRTRSYSYARTSGHATPLEHQASFAAARDVFHRLVQVEGLDALVPHAAMRMSELAPLLVATSPFAARTPDIADLHQRACRAYLEEMLTSEDAETTYYWDNNTSTRLVRRTPTQVPAVVREVIFPLILDRDGRLARLAVRLHVRIEPEDRARLKLRFDDP